MASITLRDLVVRFDEVTAVDHVDLRVEDGEFVVLLGPSGCGKTTTLRCVAGLESATSGEILFGDKPVSHLAAVDRNVAMVFQFVSLYPHLTIRGNIAFPLQARGAKRELIREKIDWVARIFDLNAILDQYPGRLPPGARQKAALARAVVRDPNVLLLDEPLSAIDETFREEMRWELRHLQKKLGVTALYVTHDQREAMSLADRIVLMRDGTLVQVGRPADLFNDPADAFAGYFIGSPPMNFIDAFHRGDKIRLDRNGSQLRLPEPLMRKLRGIERFQIGVRPQHVLTGSNHTEPGCFKATVVSHYAIGREHWFDFMIGDKAYKGSADRDVTPGEIVVKLDTDHAHLFTLEGEQIKAP